MNLNKRQKQSAIILCTKAMNLIQEKGWNQANLARDKNKHPISVTDKEAVSYCLVGAIFASKKRQSQATADNLIDYIENTICKENIIQWNDSESRKKQQVINLCKRTINSLSK